MDQAAILADAVSTPFSAVVRSGQVHMGSAVAVWGVGGVGSHIVQLAKLAGGVPVIALDVNDEVLERAKRLGADFALRSDDPDLMARATEATGGRMVDVAFDAVGIQATPRQAMQFLDVNGRLVTVGISAQEMNLGPIADVTLRRKQMVGHLGYRVTDIAMLAEMLKFGRLDLSESISAVVPLAEVERGIRMLHEHEGNPIRILVQP